MAQIVLEPLAHREAIEYFRSKGYAPQMQRYSYLDHWREDHARDFVVAKALRDDVLEAIRGELDRALAEGRTLQQFQEDLQPTLEKLGWWGRKLERDPLTGELQEVQLGSLRRLRTIFDTNMRTAHAAGHWARIQRTKKAFPYLQYIQIERPTKRHDHARFHDHIWHVDDPIWLIIYPPNGYFCGCTVIQRTEGWMRRNGRTVSDPIDLEAMPWTNRRTGEVSMVPRGITPGFDANPGATWLALGDDWTRMTPDLTPQRRISEQGIIEGLRLRRVGDGRETLVIADPVSAMPTAIRTAEIDTPNFVALDGLDIPAEASFIHSHITEATLSVDDLSTLFRHAGHSITAITPGGSIWRAARVPQAEVRPLIAEFATLIPEFAEELRRIDRAAEVFAHARMLWLERKGAVTYSYRMSARVRQMMDANADLLRRLIDARP